MLYGLSDFVGCELRCRANAPSGEVLGFLIDDRAWALRYACVRLKGGPQEPVRLLPVAAFPPVHEFLDHVSACLTPAELSHGIPLTGACEQITREQEQALHDALHWLPYWSEPGGSATSTLHDAERAIGAPLTCGGDPFGIVEDLLVDTHSWAVSAFRIATDAALDAQRLHLPPTFIRAAHWDTPRFDSDVRAAALACAPMSSLAVPGNDYFDRLRQHLSSV